MPKAIWWVCAVAAVAFTSWVGTSWSIGAVSMSCSKTGESPSFRCGDSIVHVLGIWPLLGLGLLLATPSAVAAAVTRRGVSWCAVAALVAFSIVGLLNWAATSYWGLLLAAAPLAVVGTVAAALQRSDPSTPATRRGSELWV